MKHMKLMTHAKRGMELWVAYIRIYMIAKKIVAKFAVVKNRYMEMEKRFLSGVRIRIVLSTMLRKAGHSCRQRTSQRLFR